MSIKEIEEKFKRLKELDHDSDEYWELASWFEADYLSHIGILIKRIKELERLLCISHDFLRPKYEMDSEPSH